MGWETVDGTLAIEWFPAALILTAAMLVTMFITRAVSLRILENAPDYGDRHRYIRGARWGWLVAVVSFATVIVTVSVLCDYSAWDFRATALAWLTALLPVAGSIGFLLLPEFMGHWVWAQALWDQLGGTRFDWGKYRAITGRIETRRARWAYYAAWVVGSVGLTVGPLVTHTIVRG